MRRDNQRIRAGDSRGRIPSIVFVCHDYGAHPLARFLKTGFKHCFVCIQTGEHWVRIDGMMGVPEITVTAPADYDIARFHREDNGFNVVETYQREQGFSGLAPRNCVSLAKTVISLHCPLIQTPYQLYKYLEGK